MAHMSVLGCEFIAVRRSPIRSMRPLPSSPAEDASAQILPRPVVVLIAGVLSGLSWGGAPSEFGAFSSINYPVAISRWSDLPSDLLGRILQLLELPEALSLSAVCKSWSSAAAAAGVPRSCTPWLMSWSRYPVEDPQGRLCHTEFRSLLDACKAYDVSFSRASSLAWCGASHGWLVAVDELSNLLLCNPFTFATIPLAPITDLDCVEAVHDSEGSVVGYLFGKNKNQNVIGAKSIGTWFYQKAVLSCAPSKGGDYTTMLIHFDLNQISFAMAEGRWRLASTLPQESKDRYADCVYHRGRFYALTMHGILEMWDLDDGSCEPTKSVFFPSGDGKYRNVFLRFLVSTPWGDLLQIRFLRLSHGTKRIKVQVRLVDIKKNRLVKLRSSAVFQKHAVFVGQNHSACLPTKNFPELKPNCVYFTRYWLVNRENWGFGSEGVGGVGIYNLQSDVLEEAFPSYEHEYSDYLLPSEVWITPNL
ncbi:hypothetical protein EJB05_37287, partial [Eragrostis curvula]